MNTTSSLGQEKPELSVRIVVCDYYIARPIPGIDVIYSDFRGSDIKQVPVLRIFGSAQDGHKTCLHIHGVFPYFYIPCPMPNPQPQFLYQIAASLDKSLNIALKQATSVNQHVYKISLVKGLPFYGFHDKEHLYLKVFLYNPGLIKQAVELCSNGAILGQTFQPHESHLNFTLQFFIDFNLFGMSNIDLQTVKFRKSGQSQNSNDILIDSDDSCLKSESVCYYEADCVASHIINRQRIGKGDGIENPGLEEVWNQERERRKQLNVSIGSKTLSQGRINNEETETHKKFEQMFLIKMSNLIDNPVVIDSKDLGPVNYPAESMEGSQLFDAVDVSMHLPDTTLRTSFNETAKRDEFDVFSQDLDETLVDENVALNSSLHYSQVLLNSEDFELLDMLQDLDEKPVDEDSVIRTSADVDQEVDSESEDAEYSQVYHDDTIILDPDNKTNESESTSSSWNDSFWDGANIPQIDGAFDDDHVKKVRKRKMRPLKVGLSRPKSKKPESRRQSNKMEIEPQISESDEINESREASQDFSDLHLKGVIKMEEQSLKGKIETENSGKESITSLVDKFSKDQDILSQKLAKAYDEANKYIPQAGSSSVGNLLPENCDMIDSSLSESLELCESKLGIESFYVSKIFDDSVNVENICNHENQNNKSNSSSIITPKLEYIEDDSYEKINDTKAIITPKIRPPTKNDIISSLEKYNIPFTKNPVPFFSNYKDVGEKIEVGQLMLKIKSKGARDQKVFGNVLDVTSLEEWRQLLFLQSNEIAEDSQVPESLHTLLAGRRQCVVQPVFKAPLRSQVDKWFTENNGKNNTPENKIEDVIVNDLEEFDNSQALGLNEDEINSSKQIQCIDKEQSDSNSMQITMQPDGSFLCYGSGDIDKDNSEPQSVEVDFLTVMLLEVHAAVRGELNPDPALDSIQAIFIKITNDCPPNHFLTKSSTEIVVVDNNEDCKLLDRCIFNSKITYVKSENDLIEKVIEMVKHHDPDILCGYEIEMNSWGYVIERSQILGFEMIKEISRITEKNRQKRWFSDSNDYERRVIGRIMFNVWRLFRHELALSSYSFENCMYEILKERVPSYSYAQLAAWWMEGSKLLRWMPVEYYLTRLSGTVRMMEKLDFINRTSELARLFGLQWWEVLSRGSQFRVESLMLRAARPLNLVALSPTVKQRAAMKAPECLPLIFEPESRFYTDPVIVLDFQSLYPSMMIAYNYCFSTCIGRVQNINGESAYEFGAWRLRIPKCKLEALVKNGLVHWSPVGAGYVKPAVRRGVLPALLRRILAARQAVKKGMKLQKDESVKKAMHSRQLGLKLIANVTYGYTAANFSGRMPCVELGDSVVAKGRETLERAIKLVNDSHWNAKVIYGDTDSMFVLVPGGTRAQAFQIGQQIADAVTADNPSPVALKLEKVYQPCILQTKKRYVGYMYENIEQETPVYEAKGIETVRRDGCPAGVKLLRRALCELFESHDMSRVKRSVTALLSRLMDGTLPVHELFFTREYHGPNGYRPGASAPPNEIAKRLSRRDPRSLPARGWRVSWLIAGGAPGAPLLQLAREPSELRREPAAPLVPYYATRVLLPPLHRCLALLGADVFKWWQELGWRRACGARACGGGIARYMGRARCAACGARGARSLCAPCAAAPAAAAAVTVQAAVALAHHCNCQTICRSCCGHAEYSKCFNTECPVMWRKITAKQSLDRIHEIIKNLPPQLCKENWTF